MYWLNLPATIVRNPAFIRAGPEEFRVWFWLVCYCAEQENGGRILGCGDWSDDVWRQIAHTSGDILKRPAHLWHWNNMECLIVHEYPAQQEYKVQQARRAAQKGGSRRTPLKRKAAQENGEKGGRPKKVVAFKNEAKTA